MLLHTSDPISFPELNIEVDPIRTIDLFGKFSIHLYALCIALGLILAIWYGGKRVRQFGTNFDTAVDGILFIVPLAILGARLYYCVFEWESYASDPISILYIWKGGLAIYGGVIFAALGIFIFCKWKKLKMGAILDITSLGFLIGQSIGRWGNFFNREAFGAETDFFLRMGLHRVVSATGSISYSPTVHYYHPTFLYESVWNAIGFVLLHFLSKKRQYDGQVALGYVAWYGLGRFFIEGLRTDSLYWGPFRVSQVLALLSFIAAATVLLINLRRKHDPAKLQVNITAARLAQQEAEKEDQTDPESAE